MPLQLRDQFIGVAMVEEKGVCDDERALLAGKIFERLLQAATAEINRLRKFVPKHVFGPLGDGLDVEQLFRPHVRGYGVAAPRAAAQGERWSQAEVIEIADSAVRRRRVNENAGGLHAGAEVTHSLALAVLVCVEHRGVADALKRHQRGGFVHGIFKVASAVERQNG